MNNRLTDDNQYTLEYRNHGQYETVISINHYISNNTEGETILKIKPKISSSNDFEKSTFRLSEFVALNNKTSFIVISVHQSKATDLSSFALKVTQTKPLRDASQWNHNFLHQWSKANYAFWVNEWVRGLPNTNDKLLGLFSVIDEDFLSFNGITL
jgi:hypothetical protein